MAGAAVRVEFEGVDKLRAGMRALPGQVDKAAGREFDHVAAQVASQVRGSVPHRTGALAGSISSSQVGDGAEITEGVAYAVFVEFGGRGHPHSPEGNYLYPAAQDAGPQLESAGDRAAKHAIGAIW